MAKDSAAVIELGRSFHQEGTFNVKVSESDFVRLWDSTIMHCSLAERKLLEQWFSTGLALGPTCPMVIKPRPTERDRVGRGGAGRGGDGVA